MVLYLVVWAVSAKMEAWHVASFVKVLPSRMGARP